ncbi:MAG: cobalamin-binding protein [Thiobacillus sp.]|nr:cobalamin-binding protein [Thiobacillus sp.]
MHPRWILCLCLALAWPIQAAPVRVVDDAGQTLSFAAPPQRVVSLAPHLTELLFAVDAGKQVIGVDSASDFPREAQSLARVGDFGRISFERIVALKPDLIVAWMGGNRAADLHGLKQLGVPVLLTRATALDDVARLLRLLGVASGHDRAGETRARDVEVKLATLRASVVHRQRPVAVFYQIWDRPLMTIGGTHWITDGLALCGARNIFDDLRGLSPVVSREAVLQRAPSLIVSGSDVPGLRRSWQSFAQVPAVKNQAFVQVDADLLHRLTPRLVDGVAELCAAIRPYER